MIANCIETYAAFSERSVGAVLLYDGEAALRRAMLTAGHLGGCAESGGFHVRAWSFEMVKEASGRELAGGWLALADVVMVAAIEDEAVPGHISDLLVHCAGSDRDGAIALVALGVVSAHGNEPAPQVFFDSLQRVAVQGGLRFYHSMVSLVKVQDAKKNSNV